jgi:glycosyltransferase involved in cell wall biosynthesis
MFVTGSLDQGGAERHAVTLVNRLAERGHECHAAWVKGGDGLRERLRLHDGGGAHCLGASRYFDPRALRGFAARLRELQPAAVVAANAYALMYAWLALRLARLAAPLVVTYHSTLLLGLKEQLQMAAYRPLFWSADCLVFVCEAQKRRWLRRGVRARRNEVIYNGIDTDEFRDPGAAARAAARAALGVGRGDYLIGIAAVLRPEKNHRQLVEAVARLRAAGIAARALMIGDGEMRGAVEARARALGVERAIHITGMQRDVRPWIAACDVMALCSLTEALPLAALESMALGRPLVHADVGGAAEMIVPGWNGLLFRRGDTQALVGHLTLLADAARREPMGRNARRAVESRFSERAMVDRYECLLARTVRADHVRRAEA